MSSMPSLSTDQVAAFVELARQGSIRSASKSLFITEQGVRNRLLALERQLGVELYRKTRGVRRTNPLTSQGRRFLPQAIAFLDRAGELFHFFEAADPTHEVNVVASQYLTTYVLIGAVSRFHKVHPNVRVRLQIRTEADVEQTLMDDPDTAFGLAAPYEASNELDYTHLFSMQWSFIAPLHHPLLKSSRIRLSQIADQPLILYERGSTGRQHVLDAFLERGLMPRIEMEATNTDIVVRMVEADLGVSIVPLLATGIVTDGRRVGVKSLGTQVRPIHSEILTRRSEPLSEAAQQFVEFVKEFVDKN